MARLISAGAMSRRMVELLNKELSTIRDEGKHRSQDRNNQHRRHDTHLMSFGKPHLHASSRNPSFCTVVTTTMTAMTMMEMVLA